MVLKPFPTAVTDTHTVGNILTVGQQIGVALVGDGKIAVLVGFHCTTPSSTPTGLTINGSSQAMKGTWENNEKDEGDVTQL